MIQDILCSLGDPDHLTLEWEKFSSSECFFFLHGGLSILSLSLLTTGYYGAVDVFGSGIKLLNGFRLAGGKTQRPLRSRSQRDKSEGDDDAKAGGGAGTQTQGQI